MKPHTPNSLESYWMPFTANRAFKAHPRMLTRAEGMYYWNDRGDKLIDSCAGLYTHAAGHCHPGVIDPIKRQLDTLDYAMAFQMGHPAAFELAGRLAHLTPGDLDAVFFTNSGSEAVETALKLAFAYHQARGEPQRTRLVGRDKGYHGVNFGGMSLGGIARNKAQFGPGLAQIDHLRATGLPEHKFVRGQPETGAELADDLEELVKTHGGDTIAACIVEPVAGSGGVWVPPVGYLDRLREICDRHGILLIFDEVICGFGRLGAAFGADVFNVTPDIMTLAKALTNGTVPMGAVAASDRIYDTICKSADDGAIELFHGYTYSAHPVACAAGLAALEVYTSEGLFARAASLSEYFLDRVFALEGHARVSDIRGYGMLAAVDLVPGESFGVAGAQLMQAAFDAGLVLRVGGDTAVLAPALIAGEEDIDRIVATLKLALDARPST